MNPMEYKNTKNNKMKVKHIYLAKYYEATISARGENPEHFKAMGLVISQMCTTPIFENGPSAYKANTEKIPSDEFKETVLAITVSTGLASINERIC